MSASTDTKPATPEAGPSKSTTVDDGPAPRYSLDHKNPVSAVDTKKAPIDPDTQNRDAIVSSPSSIKNPGTRSAFGMGAGASGPAPPEDENSVLHKRAATAETGLAPSVVQKITAAERKLRLFLFSIFPTNKRFQLVKDAKRVSKILKNEQKVEDKSMKQAIKDLDKVSSIQRQAAKDEASATSAYSKSVKVEHKLNMKYLAAKAAWEK